MYICIHVYMTNPHICQSNLPTHSSPPPPLGVHTCVFYVCVSISALQIGSSVPFSRFHIYVLCNIYKYIVIVITVFTQHCALHLLDSQ